MGTSATDVTPRILDSVPSGFLYQAIAADLCRRIDSGEWRIGARVPSWRTLAKEYTVGVVTVQQAIATLVSSGLLRSVDRSGTYIARPVLPTDYTALAMNATGGVVETALSRSSSEPVAGILTLGGFQTQYMTADNGPWGNLVALAVERNFSQLGGRTHFKDLAARLGDLDYLTESIAEFRELGVNVLIVIDILGVLADRCADSVYVLETCGIPAILIGSAEIISSLPFITYDQHNAGYAAAQHLMRDGYQSLLYFMPYQTEWALERLKGITAALTRYRMPAEILMVYPSVPQFTEQEYYAILSTVQANSESMNWEPNLGVLTIETVAQGVADFLQAGTARAIIAPNDTLALSLLKYARQQLGLTAGVDFGLIGFDDNGFSRQYGLTTLRPPMDAMGATAARLAFECANSGGMAGQRIAERSHLIVRNTTRQITSAN